MHKYLIPVISVSAFLPLIASAQQLQAFRTLISSFGVILNMLIPIAIAGALLAFFYGLIKYLYVGKGGGDDSNKARQFMLDGLIALFVMVSVWGLISLAQGALGLNTSTTINLPKVGVPV